MISFTKTIILTLTVLLSVSLFCLPPAEAQHAINDFNRRLNTIYKQADDDTLMQQIVFGSIEALGVWKMNNLLTQPNRQEIADLAVQIQALEANTDTKYFPESALSARERAARISQLNRRLRILEGSIAQRTGRGTASFLIKGTQLFLILDIGTRVYVLEALDHRDPGIVPLSTLFCSEVDCSRVLHDLKRTGQRAYSRTKEITSMTPERPPAPPATVSTTSSISLPATSVSTTSSPSTSLSSTSLPPPLSSSSSPALPSSSLPPAEVLPGSMTVPAPPSTAPQGQR